MRELPRLRRTVIRLQLEPLDLRPLDLRPLDLQRSADGAPTIAAHSGEGAHECMRASNLLLSNDGAASTNDGATPTKV
jgi:hypothetical protein